MGGSFNVRFGFKHKGRKHMTLKKERGSAITIFHPISLWCCSMNGPGTFQAQCKCVHFLTACLEVTPARRNWDGVWGLCPSSKTWCCTFHGDSDQAFLVCSHHGCAESPRWHLDLDTVSNLEKSYTVRFVIVRFVRTLL